MRPPAAPAITSSRAALTRVRQSGEEHGGHDRHGQGNEPHARLGDEDTHHHQRQQEQLQPAALHPGKERRRQADEQRQGQRLVQRRHPAFLVPVKPILGAEAGFVEQHTARQPLHDRHGAGKRHERQQHGPEQGHEPVAPGSVREHEKEEQPRNHDLVHQEHHPPAGAGRGRRQEGGRHDQGEGEEKEELAGQCLVDAPGIMKHPDGKNGQHEPAWRRGRTAGPRSRP